MIDFGGQARPSATVEHWAQVTILVNGALRRPDPRERESYLRGACGSNAALCLEVEELLRFEDAEAGVLESPDPETGRPDPDSLPDTPGLRPGQRIGPYRIECLLGRGGMGAVVRARDETLDRVVAVKVLRRELVSSELLSRFEGERRILARLNHSHIARILDAGSDDGMPWFAMELVDGQRLDAYCDQRQLSVDGRLELVIRVCQALDEAHRNLVVHRDLKPSNILVSLSGEPKLLDFGIAKELDPLRDTSMTRTGRRLLTPSHASPEQARGLPAAVASDVYSLGVVLYELLCGHPPYELDGDELENLRTLCESVPLPPSARTQVSRDVWRGGNPTMISPMTAALARGSTPRALQRRLRGDLDAIVMKALAKRVDDRYHSIEQLGADLRRHREGEPVLVRSQSTRYRIGRFMATHVRALVAAVLVVALGVAGAAFWHTSRDAQRRAIDAEVQAEAWTLFADNLVSAANPNFSRGRSLKPTEILDHSLRVAQETLSGQPALLAFQLDLLGRGYQGLGDLPTAIALLDESLALRRGVYDGDHRLVAQGLNNLAAAFHVSGDRTRAVPLYREALLMKRRLGKSPENLTRVQSNLASILASRGELDEAEALYRDILDVRRTTSLPDDPDLANSLRSLANVLFLKSDLLAAERVIREALAHFERTLEQPHLLTAATLSTLGRILHAQSRSEEAKVALAETLRIRKMLLGEEHWHVALTQTDLAAIYAGIGDTTTATALWAPAREILDAALGVGSWELANADSQLGCRLRVRGDLASVTACLKQAYETLRTVRGESAIMTVHARERWETTRQAAVPSR